MTSNHSLIHHHVPSGSYYIGRQEPLVIEAYLGTCVGVALYDEASKIGGLSHLLLPEPGEPWVIGRQPDGARQPKGIFFAAGRVGPGNSLPRWQVFG